MHHISLVIRLLEVEAKTEKRQVSGYRGIHSSRLDFDLGHWKTRVFEQYFEMNGATKTQEEYTSSLRSNMHAHMKAKSFVSLVCLHTVLIHRCPSRRVRSVRAYKSKASANAAARRSPVTYPSGPTFAGALITHFGWLGLSLRARGIICPREWGGSQRLSGSPLAYYVPRGRVLLRNCLHLSGLSCAGSDIAAATVLQVGGSNARSARGRVAAPIIGNDSGT
ncbi:hypothetical protein LA080_011543 [Diaporthe eres]|nr:hypothetical protein LA080_011543 [Diaporthe eres]